MSTIFDRMRQSFPDKDYRHTYANGLVDSKLATQLKVLREQRGLTQAQLAEKCGMQQARISVLEDVNYSSWSISTLRRIGKAFDLWLDVEWKEFGELPRTLQNMSRETLECESFENDPLFHEEVAAAGNGQTRINEVQDTMSMAGSSLRIHTRRKSTSLPNENLELDFGPAILSPNNVPAQVKITDTTHKGEIRYEGRVGSEQRPAA